MKICILSMQKIYNYGSLLQSYSLKKILEELEFEVSFIDIEKKEGDNKLLCVGRKNYIEEYGKKTKLNKYLLNRLKHKNDLLKQVDVMEKFWQSSLQIAEGDNQKKYDACVIGSDEVFNCMADSEWGFTSQLFGNVHQASDVITYAASCGSTTYDELPIEVKKKIEESFQRISAFSVRDKNTEIFVKQLAEKEVDIHYDPVIIGDFDVEMKRNMEISGLPDRYCLLYSYYNRFYKEEEILAIKRFCRLHDLELVTVGGPQFWIRKHLILNPFQVLVAFSKANFVITDTFHGTIFATKYATRFATLIRPSNKNKLADLVGKLELNKHLIQDVTMIDNIYQIIHDKSVINKITQEERERAQNYLRSNLSVD